MQEVHQRDHARSLIAGVFLAGLQIVGLLASRLVRVGALLALLRADWRATKSRVFARCDFLALVLQRPVIATILSGSVRFLLLLLLQRYRNKCWGRDCIP